MKVVNWRQFDSVVIDNFGENMTFITGANASGKTTILKLLSQVIGWDQRFAAVPAEARSTGEDYHVDNRHRINSAPRTETGDCGAIKWNVPGGNHPVTTRLTFNHKLQEQDYAFPLIPDGDGQLLQGCFFPAGRMGISRSPKLAYREKWPGFRTLKAELDEAYRQLDKGEPLASDASPYASFKSAISRIHDFSRKGLVDSDDFQQNLERISELCVILFPEEVGFERFEFLSIDIKVISRSGTFPLDSISGGMASMLNLAWYLFVCEQTSENCLVLIDEPENHLHPRLQRTLFPKLIKAFPDFQFVAATHSPVILGSVQDASIYALQFNDEGQVESLDVSDKLKSPATADDMLNEILGVEVLEPQWVSTVIDNLVREFETRELSEKSLDELRSKMTDMGLEQSFMRTLREIDKLKSS